VAEAQAVEAGLGGHGSIHTLEDGGYDPDAAGTASNVPHPGRRDLCRRPRRPR
jgi:hypothetical protein